VLFYFHYADAKGLLCFDKFMKFCKDFSIFPDIIPKAKLFKIFMTLAQIYENSDESTNLNKHNKS